MRRLDSFQAGNITILIIGPENSLKQSFLPRKSNFAGIRFRLFNPRLGQQKKYKLAILDAKNNVLREQIIKESNIGWGEMVRYDFIPVKVIPNALYYFSISREEIDQSNENAQLISKFNTNILEEKEVYRFSDESLDYTTKNYVQIAYEKKDLYKQGSAYLNGQKLGGDIEFQLYYQTGFSGFINDSVRDFIPHLTSDPLFLIFYLILMISLFGVLLKRIFSWKNKA